MGDIAEKVQMAKGNLYYYFPSKQDLLFFCQDESLGRLLDRASAISTSKDSADKQLRAMIVFHIKTILEELPGSTATRISDPFPPRIFAK
jgi:AcrR family transcriptional regulator